MTSAALTVHLDEPPPAPLTASSIEKEIVCTGSGAMPKVRHHNPYTGGGTRLHRFVELAAEVGPEKAAALVVQSLPEEEREKEAEFFLAIDLSAIPPGAEHEVGFAFNYRTGEVRRISGRAAGYPAMDPREWILGTTDIIGMRGPSTVFTADLKRYIFRSRADHCAQTDFYALCGVRLAGADDAETMLMRPIASGWATDRAYRDSIALEAFADSLAQLMDDRDRARRVYLAGGPQALLDRGMLATGPQCELCDAARHCPAIRGDIERFARIDPAELLALLPAKASEEVAVDVFRERMRGALARREDEALGLYREADRVRAAGDEVAALVIEERAALALETIGQAFSVARLVRMAAEGMLKAADEIAARTPIPLPNGMERYEGSTTRWVPSEAARERLAALKEQLKNAGEITSRQFPQMRTGKPRKKGMR